MLCNPPGAGGATQGAMFHCIVLGTHGLLYNGAMGLLGGRSPGGPQSKDAGEVRSILLNNQLDPPIHQGPTNYRNI